MNNCAGLLMLFSSFKKNLIPMFSWILRWEQTFLTACLNIMLDTDGRDKGQKQQGKVSIKGKKKKIRKKKTLDLIYCHLLCKTLNTAEM